MSTLNVSEVTEPLVEELAEIFRAHYRMTYRTAYGMTGSAEDAEDVAKLAHILDSSLRPRLQ
jgi:DNA-directed RNA polymerase specialized sigma24 family protein